jgi:hypothetical protein
LRKFYMNFLTACEVMGKHFEVTVENFVDFECDTAH